MYARILTFTNVDDIEDGLRFLTDKVAPVERTQPGYRGLTASVERSTGLLSCLSLWATEADRDASEVALAPIREEARHLITPQQTLENFEVTTVEMITPPQVGLALLVAPITMDPAAVDANTAFFETHVVPQTRTEEGFCGLRQYVNRRTGQGVVGSAWRDETSMRAHASSCRAEPGPRPVTIGEPSFRELVFVDPD